MWSPDDSESQELSVCSLTRTSSSGATIEGHDYTPDSPDFPARSSPIPLLHKDFSHEQTSPSRSKIGRGARNRYPSHDNRSQTRRASTRCHPFASQFEAPDWRQLSIHTVLCLLSYPLLLLVVIIASSRPLFWTRTIVALGCGLIGFTLGLIPLALGRKFLGAAGGYLILVLHSTSSLTQLYSVGHRYSSVMHSR
jgi:hypothetical protein